MKTTNAITNTSATVSGISVAAIALAGTALAGRIAAFVSAGPSSLKYLLVLLVVAIAGRAFALRAPSGFGVSLVEVTLVRFAKRIATMQVVVGAVLVLITLT